MTNNLRSPRLEIIDALRGFTLFGIILLHNIEHFDYYKVPADQPQWLYLLDQGIWKSAIFFFAGKAYGIFALLFGLSFFIQHNKNQGNDSFTSNYLWRLLVLFFIGIVNTLFYPGDILALYAVLGTAMLVICRWNSRVILLLAAILLFQPLQVITILNKIGDPNYLIPPKLSEFYFESIRSRSPIYSFTERAIQNLTYGKAATFFWSLESGRVFKTLAFFMIGFLIGRQQLFIYSQKSLAFWRKLFTICLLVFIPLFAMKAIVKTVTYPELAGLLRTTLNSWSNTAFMFVVLAWFVFIYRNFDSYLNKLSVLGRMSLTCYVMQSVIGALIFYDYGLALNRYSGATTSLLIAIISFILQYFFCKWWLRSHKQGPLEHLWRLAAAGWAAQSESARLPEPALKHKVLLRKEIEDRHESNC